MESGEDCSQLGDNIMLLQGDFTPIVDEHLIPKLGMTFDTLEKAEHFYDSYAKCGGFQMRKGGHKLKDGEVVDKTFLCNKAGVSKSKNNEVRMRTTSRTACNALVRVKLNKVAHSWSFYSFHEVHNHAFTSPGRRYLLSQSRVVSSLDKLIMEQPTGGNIPTCKQMTFFENSSGGYDKVGFTETDARNYERDLRKSVKGHDGQMLIDFFKWQKKKDLSFFYAFEQDECGRLSHCIWVDGIARMNYEEFGDVVSFDATYSTNLHGMLFVPFVGINHHWQSVFLGCGFIPNKTASSFIWLFEKWLEVMKHAPLGIITDQDDGICAAIKQVFPKIRHRYCVWHILNKILGEVPQLVQNVKFMDAFEDIIWNSYNSNFFEEKWKSLMIEYGAENNKWLNDNFEIREKWAPVYHRPHFWAGMSSSHRSETMNFFLKKHTQKKYSLLEFAVIFERVIGRQREQELKENHRTLEKKHKLKTEWYMEEQMAQVYTLVMFCDFQKQLESSLLYNVSLVEDHENASYAYYAVRLCGKVENETMITYAKGTQFGSCSCFMFEFIGIPCKHLLAFLKYSNCNELPKQYILRRWSREVIRRNYTFTNIRGIDEGNSKNFASRYCELSNLAKQQVEIGLASDEGYAFMRDNMLKCIEEFIPMQPQGSGVAKGSGTRPYGKDLVLSQVSVQEPSQCKTKGRPSGKRLKPMQEKMRAKPRKCNCCGLRGQGYDARTCPKKLDSALNAKEVDSFTGDSSDDTADSMD